MFEQFVFVFWYNCIYVLLISCNYACHNFQHKLFVENSIKRHMTKVFYTWRLFFVSFCECMQYTVFLQLLFFVVIKSCCVWQCKAIHKKIMSLNFRDCHAKIRQVDSQSTIDKAVVVQVSYCFCLLYTVINIDIKLLFEMTYVCQLGW